MLDVHLNFQQLDADLKFFNNLMAHEDQLHGIFRQPVDGSAALLPAGAGSILVHRKIFVFLHGHLPGQIIIIVGFKIPSASAPQQTVHQPLHRFGSAKLRNIEPFQ
ncbi:hypothetical protein D3C73_1022220 [compost metagenome]